MARTIQVIYNQIVSTYVAEAAAVGIIVPEPTTWGLVNRKRIWASAQAFACWINETLFDEHVKLIDETIAAKDPGTPQWYVEMAKKFQYGFSLVPLKDYYDNTGIADDVVAASKIVAYAAFVEEPATRLKLAMLDGDNLAKIPDLKLAAIVAYVLRIKYAGVKLYDNGVSITSGDPDKLRVAMRVKINPLVFNIDGSRRDGTDAAPVAKAIRNYLENIDFDGLFSTQKLEKEVLAVNGVDDLHIDSIQTKYGALVFTGVDIDFRPDAGYLVIDPADLLLTYYYE